MDFVGKPVTDKVDVELILKEVYGEKYPDLKEKMLVNEQVHLTFNQRLITMPANSTIDDIAKVFNEVKESITKS